MEAASSPPGLRDRNKRDKRRRIQRAARELFCERGFERTSARAICERAGIATGTLFLYVSDKRELLLWIFRDDAERILAAAPRDLSGHPDAISGLLDVFGPLLDFYAQEPRLSALLLRELLFRPHRETGMHPLHQALLATLGALLRDGQARGELRADVPDAELVAGALAVYCGVLLAWLGMEVIDADAARPRLERGLRLWLAGAAACPDTGE